MGLLIKGGKIITATDYYTADIRIEAEKIIAIGLDLESNGDKVIDASGCYVLPGGIDTHTHFDLDVGVTVTADNFATGTKAAIVGGTTTILDYACQYKGESLKAALAKQFEKTEGNCFCDYGFHMGITDWNDEVHLEMSDMIKNGVTSFKLYMAYKKSLQVDDSVIFKALKRSKELQGLIGFHCENGDVIEELVKEARLKGQKSPIYHAKTRPVEVEVEAITRLLHIAEILDTPVYIVHLSSGKGLKGIIKAKNRGVKVYVETCPQYLLLDESLYLNDDGAKYVMSPPLRTKDDQELLWKGLGNGEIMTIGTDHCSFNFKGQKDLGLDDFSKIPNGAPGVEHRVGILYTYGVMENKISLNQWVALTSTNAAKLFGLFPKKGTIAVGSDADLVIYDPNHRFVVSSTNQTQNVDYTPYEGFKQQGKVLHVFLRGQHIIKNGVISENKPLGLYQKRNTSRGGDHHCLF